MNRLTLACAAAALSLSGAAWAQDTAGQPMTDQEPAGQPMMEQDAAGQTVSAVDVDLIGNLGKIEANLFEAATYLYLHAMLPADAPEREDALEEYRSDIESVDAYLAAIRDMDVSDEVRTALDELEAEWEEVKPLFEAIEDADRDNLPSTEDLLAHAQAIDDLDDIIDDALVAAGLDDAPSIRTDAEFAPDAD